MDHVEGTGRRVYLMECSTRTDALLCVYSSRDQRAGTAPRMRNSTRREKKPLRFHRTQAPKVLFTRMRYLPCPRSPPGQIAAMKKRAVHRSFRNPSNQWTRWALTFRGNTRLLVGRRLLPSVADPPEGSTVVKSLTESTVLCEYIGNYYYGDYCYHQHHISTALVCSGWLVFVLAFFGCEDSCKGFLFFRLWRVSCVVDEGKFRLMPRVDAPFVRVCVLSVVGGAGVGKFWMFLCFALHSKLL